MSPPSPSATSTRTSSPTASADPGGSHPPTQTSDQALFQRQQPCDDNKTLFVALHRQLQSLEEAFGKIKELDSQLSTTGLLLSLHWTNENTGVLSDMEAQVREKVEHEFRLLRHLEARYRNLAPSFHQFNQLPFELRGPSGSSAFRKEKLARTAVVCLLLRASARSPEQWLSAAEATVISQ
ncbi:Uu.00g064790.m01.CDS01 [Anthostomella pinea]|uniref:Uu.00g064790.m01.CDS01 n=1 Tax=Anthostomella pinea TaxID=933095 RepID=A0AAI8VTP1_9PEZI|nr:Uu.00g064790.m01.CDS01 [Anthostomella pinea]